MTPRDRNYYFPAEWHEQESTWLSWPHNHETWGRVIDSIWNPYCTFVETIASSQKLNIITSGKNEFIQEVLQKHIGKIPENVILHNFTTNDSWCRDHGPGLLVNRFDSSRLILDWEYNSWGGKYPPFTDDNKVPSKIADYLGLEKVSPGIVMEGGSVEFNGEGTVITSRSCLLNKNRNPHLNQGQIEQILCDNYGVDQVLWVEDGIVGDDTDGHIDDTVRFVNSDTVITVIEKNKSDENHQILENNLADLKKMRLANGKQLNIIEIEMPDPVYLDDVRLPASYANFLITNRNVIVPTYRSQKDEAAIMTLQSVFSDRVVVGIDSTDIIWGLGSFHCLSQQEPKGNA
ncbi:MAG: agmatine deiminase family protein [Leadbetterella sp.]